MFELNSKITLLVDLNRLTAGIISYSQIFPATGVECLIKLQENIKMYLICFITLSFQREMPIPMI